MVKVKEYTFEECELGLEETFEVLVTEESLCKFKEITGDINPMHVDKGYAQGKGYKEELVYGMCTASFYSTLVGMYLPGKNALLLGVDIQFPKAVYVGDRLKVVGIIVERNEVYQRITIKADIYNQEGKKVSRAKLTVGVLE